MSNIASVLKEEISRIARKEVRAETEKLKKASAQYRTDIAGLKRRVVELEKQLSRLVKQAEKNTPAPTVPAEATKVRFSARSLIAQRRRLGLSAPMLGTLMGVSPQSIYNWESGITRPRQEQIRLIVALRGVSKEQVQAHLQQQAGQ